MGTSKQDMPYLWKMDGFPKKLHEKLMEREAEKTLRQLYLTHGQTDFFSNDYLGLARNPEIFKGASDLLALRGMVANGATGSRLLSGNSALCMELEEFLARFHGAEAALVLNSGYDANIGLFSAVPQRGDLIFYDEYIHASIRDGILMGNAKSFKYRHNDLEDLKKSVLRNGQGKDGGEIYVVTESVFSMDGDSPDLRALVQFCKEQLCRLIVDEAHAVGVFGGGLLQQMGLHREVFARTVTFGKALGCHGATVLGSTALKQYLINFCRSFIYTTAMPPHSLATVLLAYKELSKGIGKERLHENIGVFKEEVARLGLDFIGSDSAIHCCVVPGNFRVIKIALELQKEGFGVRGILYPTVPKDRERLRFCLHSHNSREEIVSILGLLAKLM